MVETYLVQGMESLELTVNHRVSGLLWRRGQEEVVVTCRSDGKVHSRASVGDEWRIQGVYPVCGGRVGMEDGLAGVVRLNVVPSSIRPGEAAPVSIQYYDINTGRFMGEEEFNAYQSALALR